MTKIIFIEADGSEKEIGTERFILLEVAHNNGISLEGSMRRFLGMFNLSYYSRKKFFDQLPEPSEEEEDMLDLAWGLTHT